MPPVLQGVPLETIPLPPLYREAGNMVIAFSLLVVMVMAIMGMAINTLYVFIVSPEMVNSDNVVMAIVTLIVIPALFVYPLFKR